MLEKTIDDTRSRVVAGPTTRGAPPKALDRVSAGQRSLRARAWRGGEGARTHTPEIYLASITNVPILNTRRANLAPMRPVYVTNGPRPTTRRTLERARTPRASGTQHHR